MKPRNKGIEMILVIEASSDDYGKTLELQGDRKGAMIRKTDSYVQVICRNACNRVWRGAGKHFHGENAWDRALEAYKSSDMRELILFARQEIAAGELFAV